MKKFELIEHTADVGVRVYGANEEELFANAAYALFSIMTTAQAPAGRLTRSVSLTAPTIDELLVVWLNELVSLFYAENFFSANFSISLAKTGGTISLVAEISGDELKTTQTLALEVKAATYHGLRLEKTRDGFVAEVIFDV